MTRKLPARKGKPVFSVTHFLARTGTGRTNTTYITDQAVFTQGDLADELLSITQGQIKLCQDIFMGTTATQARFFPTASELCVGVHHAN